MPGPSASAMTAWGQSLPKWAIRAMSAFPRLRPLSGHRGMSQTCHLRTQAPQQSRSGSTAELRFAILAVRRPMTVASVHQTNFANTPDVVAAQFTRTFAHPPRSQEAE